MVDAEDTLVTPVKPPGSPKGEKPGRPVMEKEAERQLRRLVRLSDNEVELLALEDFTTLNDLVLLDIGGSQSFLPAEVAGEGVRIARYCPAKINFGNPGSCLQKLSVKVVCGILSLDSFQMLTIH